MSGTMLIHMPVHIYTGMYSKIDTFGLVFYFVVGPDTNRDERRDESATHYFLSLSFFSRS